MSMPYQILDADPNDDNDSIFIGSVDDFLDAFESGLMAHEYQERVNNALRERNSYRGQAMLPRLNTNTDD